MLAYLIKMLIFSGTLYLLYHWLLRRETYFHLNRIYLLAILAISITIPFLHLSLNSDYTQNSLIYSFINGTQDLFFVVWLDEVVISAKAPYSFNWVRLLEVAYIIGIFVFALRIPLFIYRIIRLRVKSRAYKCGNVVLLVHNEPFTAFSFWNYIYVNKEEFQDKNFKVVWKHELAHIRYGHTVESFLLEIICCFFWFNPFVWAVKNRLKEVHEFQVDSNLVQREIDTIDYQKHLLNYVLDGNVFAGGNHFATTAIKRRVSMLITKPSSWVKKMRFLVVIPVLVFLMSAFSFENENNHETLGEKQPVNTESFPTRYKEVLDTIPVLKEEKLR